MEFVSFCYKIIMKAILFLILICAKSSSSSTSSSLYQLVKINEDYETYMLNDIPQSYVKIDMKQFYSTIHNLDHKRIPRPYGEYDYKQYENELKYYCEHDYITMEYFVREQHIKLFESLVRNLKSCFDNPGNDKTNIRETADFKQTILNSINKMTDGKQDKKIALLLKSINEIESDSITNKFNLCTNIFKTKYIEIFYEKKGFLSKKPDHKLKEIDVLLIKTILENPNCLQLDGSGRKMYYDYTQLADNIRVTDDDRAICLEKLNIMDSIDYTATKISYLVFPTLTEDVDLKNFIEKRVRFIKTLMYFDEHNETILYTNTLKYYGVNESGTKKSTAIDQDYFTKMKCRRAIKSETNYESYIMRLNFTEYLPLPIDLWKKERSASGSSPLREYILNEFSADKKKLFEDSSIHSSSSSPRLKN